MKVVFIISYSKGGLPHYAAELANSIAKNENIEITVFKPKDLDENIFSDNVKIVNVFESVYMEKNLKIIRNIRTFKSFKEVKLINKIKPDIIHIHSSLLPLPIFLSLYRIDRNYPIIITLHAIFSIFNFQFSDLKDPLKLGAYFSQLTALNTIKSASKIIVHTIQDRIEWSKRGLDPKKIVVIPHGAYSFFKEIGDENREGSQEDDAILFFGQIRESKGVEYLIKAMPIVWKKLPNVKAIIAGEGNISEYSKYLRDKRFEVINKFIPNQVVSRLFRQAKVVVLPYAYHQGHSGVLTIALTFGKPVVVTAIGSLLDVVKNGREGLVVPPGDPKALADAIIKILEDDMLRKKMSRNALKKAEELSWDNIARKHIRVYGEVLERWKTS